MINSKDLLDKINEYKATQDTITKVHDIFLQGDSRYSDPEYEAIVAGFIDNDAITLREKTLEIKNVDVNNIRGPQKEMKSIAIGQLEGTGHEIVSIERGFMGGIPDVLARKGDSMIAVECGPCTIRKAVDYLENDNTSLWIIRPNNKQHELFIISKSSSWDAYLKFHKNLELQNQKKHIENAFRVK